MARPSLVWLHGLLGSSQEWQQILPYFNEWPCIALDLPGHGSNSTQMVTGFSQLNQWLTAILATHQIEKYWLIGYSLGGRIALYHACHQASTQLAGVIVEGAHLGLQQSTKRNLRWQQDQHWAMCFRQQPIEQVLTAWYQQPVFAELSMQERERLIAKRCHNQGTSIAAMLEATSLSKQPWLGNRVQQLDVPFCYLCGEQDSKFQSHAAQYQLPVRTIENAGHNAHLANPSAFAAQLRDFLLSY